jgi:light-harvesting complex 1 beta chain
LTRNAQQERLIMAQTHNALQRAPSMLENRKDLLIFGLSFAVFLVIALTGQLLGRPWREWLPGAEGVGSLFGGVKAAVYTFMSHLI